MRSRPYRLPDGYPALLLCRTGIRPYSPPGTGPPVCRTGSAGRCRARTSPEAAFCVRRTPAACGVSVRHHLRVPMTQENFAHELVAAVPVAQVTVDEHLRDNDELLLHLLMADLLRLAVDAYRANDNDTSQRLLAFVERALREGDEAVENAVCVSFVEHVGAGAGESEEFIASWPDGLRDEVNRQRG